MSAAASHHQVAPPTDPQQRRALLGLRWWREIAYIGVFYLIYSAIRNQFGSAAVSPDEALEHARQVIDLQQSVGLYFEEDLQALFVTGETDDLRYQFPGARAFLMFWNVFYGTLHFVLTGGVLIWLFRRHPDHYVRWRNVLAVTTALALVGFSLYSLMPPRLLSNCGDYGACLTGEFGFVDTLADVGGLWSFDSGTMQAVSNQYAAMPSLHFGWSLWCVLAIYPHLRSRWARAAIVVYPVATLWAIMVTANHYWLDAVGGALTLALGIWIGNRLTRFATTRRLRKVDAVDEHDEHDASLSSG